MRVTRISLAFFFFFFFYGGRSIKAIVSVIASTFVKRSPSRNYGNARQDKSLMSLSAIAQLYYIGIPLETDRRDDIRKIISDINNIRLVVPISNI